MPRGEETQEVPQEEGREQSNEIKEQDLEAQRDQEVVSEPEAVVERERPVEESEAIEAAVVEAVEAVVKAPALSPDAVKEDGGRGTGEDGGPETGNREEAAEAAADGRPGTEEREGEAIASTEDRGPGTGEGTEQKYPEEEVQNQPGSEGGEVAATPINLPNVADDPDPILQTAQTETAVRAEGEGLEETSSIGESQAEVGEVILDDTSFKVEIPQPDQEIRQESEDETARSDIPFEEEAGEILAEGDFKPIPAEESAEEVTHEDHWSGRDGSEAENDPIPAPSPALTGEEGESAPLPLTDPTLEGEGTEADDEGSSILIGEESEEELQEIDLTAEASKEVDEYWEPPEMYVYQHKDGSIEFVDKNGKPIDSPPFYKVNSKDNTIQAWYQGANKGDVFSVNEFSGYSADEIYAYHGQDGSITFVDANGIPVSSPPPVVIENGSVCISKKVGIGYSNDSVQEYTPPTAGIYAYTNQDGSIDIVDKNGELIKCPPHFFSQGNTGKVYFLSDGEDTKEIPSFTPPIDGIYIYAGQDGSYSVVDKNGIPVKSPPHLAIDGSKFPHILEEPGKPIYLSEYKPPQTDVYAYTAQDGSVNIVDKYGNQVKSPPHFDLNPITGKVTSKGKDDSTIYIEAYQPPITDIYVHINQDNSITIVDANGKSIESPPHVVYNSDSFGNSWYTARYAGTPIENSIAIKNYKPPSSHWDKKPKP